MVERDVREHHDPRAVEDVGRVVAATEPRLDRGRFDLVVSIGDEGDRGDDLELRRPDLFGRRADMLDQLVERDLRAVDPDALAPGADMR